MTTAPLPAPRPRQLPWQPGRPPLMLAPMQSLTNRALRSLFAEWVRPDVLFTEFMRVRPLAAGGPLARKDLNEARAEEHGIPLVVQLIGRDHDLLVGAAADAQLAGAVHLNLNLGCPFARMTAGSGGGLLQHPEELAALLRTLRATFAGSFSVKVRSGFSDPEQIFELLPLFEEMDVDFLVLHPRTVRQQYEGEADHSITARVVRRTRLPVIANGDVRTVEQGRRVLEETGAVGLMLGRGAIADPELFLRLRGEPASSSRPARAAALERYLAGILERYSALFCGDAQVLSNVKALLHSLDEAEFPKSLKRLRRAKSVAAFREALAELHAEAQAPPSAPGDRS